MALNPTLRQMVADAQQRYVHVEDPLEAKHAETLALHADNDDEPEAVYPTVMEQLVLIGLRKATKRELRQIVVSAMVAGA